MKGAVSYASAGEVTPTLTLIGNRIERNCKQLYGNFSTCSSALNLDVQNMNSLYFMVGLSSFLFYIAFLTNFALL